MKWSSTKRRKTKLELSTKIVTWKLLRTNFWGLKNKKWQSRSWTHSKRLTFTTSRWWSYRRTKIRKEKVSSDYAFISYSIWYGKSNVAIYAKWIGTSVRTQSKISIWAKTQLAWWRSRTIVLPRCIFAKILMKNANFKASKKFKNTLAS